MIGDIQTVTDFGAVAAFPFIGMNDKLGADLAATDMLRKYMSLGNYKVRVAIGEYEKDKSYGLQFGEMLGEGEYKFDIAVDPIEGTTALSQGRAGAVCVMAMGHPGAFPSFSNHYMEKLNLSPWLAKEHIHPAEGVGVMVERATRCLGRRPFVCVLERDRNQKLVEELRCRGCPVSLIPDCDVVACLDRAYDIYAGIGGTPEGVISAAGTKCLGGKFWGRLCKPDLSPDGDWMTEEQLAKGSVCLSISGITTGPFLNGVEDKNGVLTVHSFLMSRNTSISTIQERRTEYVVSRAP